MDCEECKAQTFADDTTLTIAREEETLMNGIKYIEEFKKISGLAANLKKTVIPFENFFNPGNKICHDLEVNWTDNFKYLGLEIDNKLELMGQNFEKAHTKACKIISDRKACKLPINGRITIIKCLIISKFNL